jgi:hypothetical protein
MVEGAERSGRISAESPYAERRMPICTAGSDIDAVIHLTEVGPDRGDAGAGGEEIEGRRRSRPRAGSASQAKAASRDPKISSACASTVANAQSPRASPACIPLPDP